MNDAEIKLQVKVDGDKASSTLGKIGKVGAGIGKAVMIGAGAAGTALIGFLGKSVQMSGELEQQIGGTEAVFGNFATQVQDMSKKAFSQSGLSANTYMATINKMGALMQGSGVEQKTAMDLSSQAMQRASDVASIMGIDIGMAMDSIAGAAKGNYTMMDNLGVAMNQTELENYALSKGLNKTYSEMSKGEQVQLAMQMFLEKSAYATGNYAKENETFAGSMQTMKASLENFMSGTGDISELIDSVVSFGKILVEKIVEMAPKIISGIVELINAIIPLLPGLIQSILPTLISGIASIIQGIMQVLPKLVKTILPAAIQLAVDLIIMLAEMLPEMLPILLKAVIDGAIMIMLALAKALPDMIPQIIEAILSMIPVLIDNLPLFIYAGMQLIIGLAKGLIQSIPILLKYLPKIGTSIWNYLKQLPGLALKVGKDLIYGLWDGIKNVTAWLYNKIKGFVSGALSKIKGFFGIKSPSKEFAIIGRYNIEGLEEGIEGEERNLNKTLTATLGSGLDLANKMGLGLNRNSGFGIGNSGSMIIMLQQPDIIMDGNKVGRATIPYITKTVKLSGGNV